MKRTLVFIGLASLACFLQTACAQGITLETAPPVVVKTIPRSGQAQVDPGLKQIEVTFSKPMMDQSWSWVQQSKETFPGDGGTPRYMPDQRTCVLPVKLEPGKFYLVWLNREPYMNFVDASRRPAVPYLLTFSTAGTSSDHASSTEASQPPRDTALAPATDGPSAMFLPSLNEEQTLVVHWTDRQFRSYFDNRTFEGWNAEELKGLETKLIDSLNGPVTREYYQAINTLGAMKSTNALLALRKIAYERVDKNNRDRWMAIRALGLIGQQEDVPELIHLVYHGNTNTRWWAQVALVRITGQNFGSDWQAWANWWNGQGGQPAYNPEIIRWWSGQPEPEKLAESLAEANTKFFEGLRK